VDELHEKTKRPLFLVVARRPKGTAEWRGTMKLTPRKQRRRRGPQIAIRMDEITADLNYRGGEPRRAGTPAPVRSGRR
jgi:endonuclease V-like protein UPF0215 family